MSVKTKMVLSLVGTLLIGVVLGALLLGAVSQYRVQQTEKLRTSDGFTEEIISAARADEEQERELRQVLGRHSERMDAIRSECRSELRSAADSMRQEMRVLLSDEQQEHVMERLGEIRESRRGHGRRSR